MSKDGRGNPPMDLKNYAGVKKYDRGPLKPWKHSGIQEDDSVSVFRQASNFARSVAGNLRHPYITYKAWKNKRRGGKNKSRKSRKNRKTRSRKNRKTRSRK